MRPGIGHRIAGERGSAMVAALFSIILIITVCLGGLYLASTYIARSEANGKLSCAIASSDTFERETKNSDDLARALGRRLGQSLYANGWSGTGTLTVCELTANEIRDLTKGKVTGESDRAISVSLEIEYGYNPLVPGSIIGAPDGAVTLHAKKTWALHPYSPAGSVWRPSSLSRGTYTITVDPYGNVSVANGKELAPSDLTDEARTALKGVLGVK